MLSTVVNSRQFDFLILAIIVFNTVRMAQEGPVTGVEDPAATASDHFEIFFTAAFTLEAALKIYAFGFVRYWQSPWNKLDFVVVCESCGTMGLSLLALSGAGGSRPEWVPNTSMLRLARLLRPLRTLKFIPVREMDVRRHGWPPYLPTDRSNTTLPPHRLPHIHPALSCCPSSFLSLKSMSIVIGTMVNAAGTSLKISAVVFVVLYMWSSLAHNFVCAPVPPPPAPPFSVFPEHGVFAPLLALLPKRVQCVCSTHQLLPCAMCAFQLHRPPRLSPFHCHQPSGRTHSFTAAMTPARGCSLT